MYIPPAFEEGSLPLLHQTIRQARIAQLVTHGDAGLDATPLPLLLDASEGPHGTLYGHIARANPLWRTAIDGAALAIFMGPDAYVSPSWYPSKQRDGKVVPTWNYVTVHAHGPVEFFDDPDRLLAVVTRLTERHEAERAAPWAVADAPAAFVSAHLRHIVGIRLPIARLDGKRKMSQNRSAEDRAGVAAGLAASADPADRNTAAQMAPAASAPAPFPPPPLS
ncbi:FMN-binding negative transcriptional regulator [Robbsia sp. Bb-Pol-6]|uniref:FMN-binding negative transcriptional regulator n=1 Tax=Robbsia betulipollinis TaxID=2981849 RepID=A0ABT3ZL48_9BURK|nr:FMN-binding negative transcriptional regulator [Robbsia betulipollinis]MCY0387254.1 FMN-binding negative transcriptional regulator [Robbsia betulipollinis]